MKLIAIAAAALAAFAAMPASAAPVTSAPALAVATPQHTVVTKRTVVRRGYHGHRTRTRTVCRREWRRGHRVRVCRRVSYRY